MKTDGPLSVLIADDNKDAADVLAELLGLHGYAARVVYSGPAAVAAALADPPDCAILDLGLPGLDGFGVARELRGRPATAGVRLVAYSGYTEADIGSAARDAGFDHHLIKGRADPEDIRDILSMLDAVRGLARAAAQEIREVKDELRGVKEELKGMKEELQDRRPDPG